MTSKMQLFLTAISAAFTCGAIVGMTCGDTQFEFIAETPVGLFILKSNPTSLNTFPRIQDMQEKPSELA